ncbi:uncharacterized protein LOC126845397 [Adelges cooleyi]|uniref:uncharacterized protein LOC126845397 n=1 Tax=Adelges cooleyi TaxID=133065 RepID=UPI00218042A9|nr:uncharacterized protein LOC126845397 [Adelges cooleyi]
MDVDVLDITRRVEFDDRITKYEFHTYQPFSSNSLTNNDEIRIAIQHQDLYTLPSESLLCLQGSVVVTPATDTSDVTIVTNGLMFLFDEIRYELNSVEIDRVRQPGVASTLKGYVTMQKTVHGRYANAGWSANTTKKFDVVIPLRLILGFCEDHRKLIINARQELVLHRASTDSDALTTNAAAASVVLDHVTWTVPHVNVNDSVRLQLLKALDAKKPLSIAFRSWELFSYPSLPRSNKHSWAVKTSTHTEKPRYVIVALQTDRKNKLATNSSQFDGCGLTTLKVYLNSESYPYDTLKIDYAGDKFSFLYNMYASFQESYYGVPVGEPLFTAAEFKSTSPIVVVDCSKQNDFVKNAPIDLRIDFETASNVADNTAAYCLIVHDKIFEYNALTSEVHKIL